MDLGRVQPKAMCLGQLRLQGQHSGSIGQDYLGNSRGKQYISAYPYPDWP